MIPFEKRRLWEFQQMKMYDHNAYPNAGKINKTRTANYSLLHVATFERTECTATNKNCIAEEHKTRLNSANVLPFRLESLVYPSVT
jgi:hypothetical protein